MLFRSAMVARTHTHPHKYPPTPTVSSTGTDGHILHCGSAMMDLNVSHRSAWIKCVYVFIRPALHQGYDRFSGRYICVCVCVCVCVVVHGQEQCACVHNVWRGHGNRIDAHTHTHRGPLCPARAIIPDMVLLFRDSSPKAGARQKRESTRVMSQNS